MSKVAYERRRYGFPLELAGMVMRELAGMHDKRALAATSLVCKSWSTEGARSLFHEIHLNKAEEVDSDLQILLNSSARVRDNLGHLTLGSELGQDPAYSGATPRVAFTNLLRVLARLPKIKYLRLAGLYLHAKDDYAEVYQQFVAKQLTLDYFAIFHPVPASISIGSHMLLLSGLGNVALLHIQNPHNFGLKWLTLEDFMSTMGSSRQLLRRSQPLQIEGLLDMCTAPDILQRWVCGVLWPDQEAILDTSKTRVANAYLYPIGPWEPPYVNVPALTPIESMANLEVLTICTDFHTCMKRVEACEDQGIDVVQGMLLPNLASHPRLRELKFTGITLCPMDMVSDSDRENLGCMWDAMITMLENAPPTLQLLELTMVRSWEPAGLIAPCDTKEMFGNILYEGREAAVARQPYDWNLLGDTLAESGINQVHIKMILLQDGIDSSTSSAHSDNPHWIPSELWSHFPETVRIIRSAMPENCQVKFSVD